MAVPVNISDLLDSKVIESTRIEFKEGFNPTEILHTICAFANDIDNIGGGYIVMGVKADEGVPVFPLKGIPRKDIDGILKKLLELCHFIEPYYAPVAEPVFFDNVHLIVLWCPGGLGRPYKASKNAFSSQSVKEYYIRKFSSTVKATPEEERELFYISTSIPFDDQPNLAASPDDLDVLLIREYLKKTGSSLYVRSANMNLQELADSIQLLEGPPENLHPRNVGILMFSQQVQKYFRYARIEIVDIPEPTGKNMTEKTFIGPLQHQLNDALLYIQNYILRQMVIKTANSPDTKRVWNYPYTAVREILANAVYHRSYQISEPTTVRITPERMEITSFPGFSRSITDHDIAAGRIQGKIYRNRRIGDFLKEMGLIEGRNTGFPNTKEALTNNGSPQLEFEMDAERHYLSVIIPVNQNFITKRVTKNNAYESRIEELLKESPLTLTELSTKMGYKGITRKLRETIRRMVEENKIKIDNTEGRIKYTVNR